MEHDSAQGAADRAAAVLPHVGAVDHAPPLPQAGFCPRHYFAGLPFDNAASSKADVHLIACFQYVIQCIISSLPSRSARPASLRAHSVALVMPCRYVLVLGHSFQRTNAAFIAAARPDMVLMTYANVTFPPETVAAFAAVGWQTRNVRHPANCAAACVYMPTPRGVASTFLSASHKHFHDCLCKTRCTAVCCTISVSAVFASQVPRIDAPEDVQAQFRCGRRDSDILLSYTATSVRSCTFQETLKYHAHP